MTDAAAARSCCAAAYASDAARYLLGESFHPGGTELTDELIAALRAGRASAAADVGSGLGTSALRLARATGCSVVGIDLAPENVAAATARAEREGLASRVRFERADAEALPLAEASVDAVLSECALCLFPDKRAAAREMARVIRPGGRLALADVAVGPAPLPAELRTLDAYVACLGGAVPLEETARIVERAGFHVESIARRDAAVTSLLDRIEARVRLARLIGLGPLAAYLDRADTLLRAARRALDDGALGYGIVLARRA